MDLVVETDLVPINGATVPGRDFKLLSGGKGANQAVAAARLGAATTMIGAVGDDAFGGHLIGELGKFGIRSEVEVLPGSSTGVASIWVHNHDNRIIVVEGSNGSLSPQHVKAKLEAIAESDILLLQLEISEETIIAAAEIARAAGVKIVLNPAPARPLSERLLAMVSYLTPNLNELAFYAGVREEDMLADRQLLAAEAMKFIERGVESVVVTLGAEGAYYWTAAANPPYCRL